jgi:hypothetical protein
MRNTLEKKEKEIEDTRYFSTAFPATALRNQAASV